VKTTEFDLIERIRARVSNDPSVAAGIGDDAALLKTRPGRLLVASTDSLVPDRHFLSDWPPAVLGHLALAVNLSDLAAMGADPRWTLLALTLPAADARWLDGFLDGFLDLAAEHAVVLVGGNLARGPLNIGVQALGEVAEGRAARRAGARPGDVLAVTGTLGDAAAAWRLGAGASPALIERWQRPAPRVRAGRIAAPWVHAMMDLSDGLLADTAKLIGASSCGARIELERLPASPALLDALPTARERQRLQAEGGSDYELLMALDRKDVEALSAELAEQGSPMTVIGEIIEGDAIEIVDDTGQRVEMSADGWDHFKS
jgi:thiamine-monophosphate kinase